MKPLNYLYYNVILLQVGRQYKIEKSTHLVWKLLHYFLRAFYTFYLIFGLISVSVDIKRKGITEFESLALNYGFVGITLCIILKSTYYYVFEDKCKDFVLKMNSVFKYETQTGLDEKSMARCLRISNISTLAWSMIGETIVSLFALVGFPFGADSETRTLLIPMWLPYDYTVSPLFEITYAIQAILMLLTVLMIIASDMFFASTLMLTAEQFKLLGWELKNVLYTSLLQSGIPKETVYEFRQYLTEPQNSDNRNVFAALKSEEFAKNAFSNINRLISFHQSLLSFCADLKGFYAPFMLFFFFVIMFTAMFLNVIVITTRDKSVAFSCLPLCIGAYGQIIFPCLFGEIFTDQCEALQTDLYEMSWYEFDQKFKKNYIFLLHRTSMPLSITLGKFGNVNMALVLWAVKTINSYCMVIYQMSQEN